MDYKHKKDWYTKNEITRYEASGGLKIGSGLKVVFILI